MYVKYFSRHIDILVRELTGTKSGNNCYGK